MLKVYGRNFIRNETRDIKTFRFRIKTKFSLKENVKSIEWGTENSFTFFDLIYLDFIIYLNEPKGAK